MLHIVTDSTAYLPAELRERRCIHTVPLKVNMGGVDGDRDEDKVALDQFYRHLATVATAPTTSQPAPGEFIKLYQSLIRNGDEILSIHISEGLSGTVRVAQMAAQEVAPDRITVIDSRSATCALALMVVAAADAIEAGAGRADAAQLIERMVARYAGVFMVENLEYLAKGGRINGAARFLGNMLHLRPILYLNEGKIDGLTVARTRKRGLQQVVEEVRKRVGDVPIHASVTHIQCPDDAAAFAGTVQREFQCANFFVHETGPVIGSHVGPGFVGFAACPVAA